MDKLQNIEDVIKAVQERPDVAPYARKVGVWIWAEFPGKPSEETREFLKAIGFHWNKTRLAWQHNCGTLETYTENGHPILTDFASVFPGGKRPNLHPDRHNFPTKGKTVAQRMENYVKLCKKAGKELTPETTPGRYVVEWEEPKEHTKWVETIRGGRNYGKHRTNRSRRRRVWRYEPGTVTLTNCSSWARFVINEDSEREQLEGDTAQALEFWAMVRTELTTGL